jgi:hypothetical protein
MCARPKNLDQNPAPLRTLSINDREKRASSYRDHAPFSERDWRADRWEESIGLGCAGRVLTLMACRIADTMGESADVFRSGLPSGSLGTD